MVQFPSRASRVLFFDDYTSIQFLEPLLVSTSSSPSSSFQFKFPVQVSDKLKITSSQTNQFKFPDKLKIVAVADDGLALLHGLPQRLALAGISVSDECIAGGRRRTVNFKCSLAARFGSLSQSAQCIRGRAGSRVPSTSLSLSARWASRGRKLPALWRNCPDSPAWCRRPSALA